MTGEEGRPTDVDAARERRGAPIEGCPEAGSRPLTPDLAALVAEAFSAHSALLLAYVRHRTRDTEVAADIVQEAFARLADCAAQGRYPADPRAWLFAVSRNLLVSQHRHEVVMVRFAERLRGSPTASAEDVAIARHNELAAFEAVSSLDSPARSLMVMTALGYSRTESAQRLGRSPLATRALLFRTRRRLRADLVAPG